MRKSVYKKGFTLFFALLVSSLALAIGLAIYDITQRELTLSEVATQSQYAVYAADSGAECALYWENKYVGNGGSNSAFATSSADTQYPTSGIICNGQDVAAAAVAAHTWPQSADASDATTTFMIGTAGTQAPCTIVYVYKSGFPSATTVVSHGYNTCTTGSLQLERVFQVSY